MARCTIFKATMTEPGVVELREQEAEYKSHTRAVLDRPVPGVWDGVPNQQTIVEHPHYAKRDAYEAFIKEQTLWAEHSEESMLGAKKGIEAAKGAIKQLPGKEPDGRKIREAGGTVSAETVSVSGRFAEGEAVGAAQDRSGGTRRRGSARPGTSRKRES